MTCDIFVLYTCVVVSKCDSCALLEYIPEGAHLITYSNKKRDKILHLSFCCQPGQPWLLGHDQLHW